MTETTEAHPRLIEFAVPEPVVAYRIVDVGTAPIRHTEPPAGIPKLAVDVADAAAAPAATKIGVVDPFATTRSRLYSVDDVVYSAVVDEIPLVIVVKYETARATRLPYGVLLMRACGHRRRYSVVGTSEVLLRASIACRIRASTPSLSTSGGCQREAVKFAPRL